MKTPGRPLQNAIHNIIHCLIVVLVTLPVTTAAQEGTADLRKRFTDFANAKQIASDGVSLQRFSIPPQAEILQLARGKKSTLLRAYCLDQDLPAPGERKTEYKYVHTLGQPFVTVGVNKTISFEEALGNTGAPPVLRIEATSSSEGECRADGCYYLEFENLSTSNLAIKFPRAVVFGRVEGRLDNRNPRDAQLLRALDEPVFSNRRIWNVTARLARLRMLGFWPTDGPLDAVTSEAQDQAELAAQKILGVGAPKLDDALRHKIKEIAGGYYESPNEPFREYRANDAARANLPYVVTIRSTGTGFIRIQGVTVSEVRLRGSLDSLGRLFVNEHSFLEYSNTGYEMEIRAQRLALPPPPSRPSGSGRDSSGGSSGGPPIWVDLNAKDFSAVAQKAQEDGCSVEYCVSVVAGSQTAAPKDGNVEQKASLECRGVGFGLSTKGKAELKLGLISISTP